jgi:hypothetical protein
MGDCILNTVISTSAEQDSNGRHRRQITVFYPCAICLKEFRQYKSYLKHLYEHEPHWDYYRSVFNHLRKNDLCLMMDAANELLMLKDYTESHGCNK